MKEQKAQKSFNNPQTSSFCQETENISQIEFDFQNWMQTISNSYTGFAERKFTQKNRYQNQRRRTEWEQYPDQSDTRILRSVDVFKQEQFSGDARSFAYTDLLKKYKVEGKLICQIVKRLQKGDKILVLSIKSEQDRFHVTFFRFFCSKKQIIVPFTQKQYI